MAIYKIQIRRDTSANFTSANPILSSGEPALETDTGREKIGNGVSPWISLPYRHEYPIGTESLLNTGTDVDNRIYSPKILADWLAGKNYLTSFTETDPTVPAHVKSITSTDISNWNLAEANVQSDWNATSGSAMILNKPEPVDLTGYATQSYVDTALNELIDSAPGTLDTLNELATALGNDPNFATTITNQFTLKADKATTILAGDGLTGGGTLGDNRTISLDSTTISDIAKGVTAEGWGNHASQGYLTSVPAQTWNSITGKPTTIGGYGITDFNSLGDARWALTSHNHSGVYEPVFTKNTGFNKNYGTTSGTVAQGNDSRINNGQTAFSWGNHASAGYSTQTLIAGTGIDITGSTISATAVPIGPTPSQTGTVLDISNNTTGILYNLITPSTANSFSVTNLVRGGFITNYIDTTGKADFPTVTNSSGSVIPSKSDAFREGATFKMMIETDGTNIEVFYIDYLNLAQTGGITYTAGTNINIDGNNVISATDTTYSAGTGITISGGNVISATGGGGPTYTAGANINIDGSNVISATYTAGTGISITNGVIAATGGGGSSGALIYSPISNTTGIIRSDRNQSLFGAPGLHSVDFSYTETGSLAYGAKGAISTCFGSDNESSGVTSTATGYRNKATGSSSFVANGNNEASGSSSAAFGSYTTATASYAFATGRITNATGQASSTMGSGNTAATFGETVLGVHSTLQPGSSTTIVGTDRAFNVGVGTSSGARADGLTVLKNGSILGPSLTEALIDSGTGRILITKEYLKASNIDWSGLPTSASGLQTGDIWNNGGVLTIV